MPLKKTERISESAFWSLWEIRESEEELLDFLKIDHDIERIISNIRNNKKRLECISGRLALKNLLEEIGESYHGIWKDDHGKPFLKESDFHISLSHSFPYVAAMINKKNAVGIDIEKIDGKIKRIEHKFLNEQEMFDANHEIEKLILLWSTKESIYKAFGRRNITFKDQIEITPFELLPEGSLNAKVKVNGSIQFFEVSYLTINGFILTYTL